uniref:Calcineurin-like phosphoesterase domain-containing protein n=1 Tax=Chromera velia CCMP2878 TaxID=1169474 RepID=A0A0G4GNY6_9ALVE|eukprot:Cvel_4991.t1-p1 / transcript=Cvel_4991.t1 / gene=Cvel_4991 / organism=Chromera_velia_CCMP2878 / gene_product=hypothetical protein / transcript_product=hypothetical protein / location=Cvel_scaffold226:9575-17058(+) / protein_length=739 / sequence_SO=supercontig / SO=protein_coding / is_pseudo=false
MPSCYLLRLRLVSLLLFFFGQILLAITEENSASRIFFSRLNPSRSSAHVGQGQKRGTREKRLRQRCERRTFGAFLFPADKERAPQAAVGISPCAFCVELRSLGGSRGGLRLCGTTGRGVVSRREGGRGLWRSSLSATSLSSSSDSYRGDEEREEERRRRLSGKRPVFERTDFSEHLWESHRTVRRAACIRRTVSSPEGEGELAFTSTSSFPHKRNMRVWLVSDIHTDYSDNLSWISRLNPEEYHNDIILVPGDISDRWDTLLHTLRLLLERFAHVVFVPGNHDLWIARDNSKTRPSSRQFDTSVEKLRAILSECDRMGVITRPTRFTWRGAPPPEADPSADGSFWIVPLLSWYHSSFDEEPDVPFDVPAANKVVMDFPCCTWPDHLLGGRASSEASKELREGGGVKEGAEGGTETAKKKNPVEENEDDERSDDDERIAKFFDRLNDERMNESRKAVLERSSQARRGGDTLDNASGREGGESHMRVSAAPKGFDFETASSWWEIDSTVEPVISCSHFLPRQELLPEKRYLMFPNLPKAVGSKFLRSRVDSLKPDLHVFGHTHFGWDMEIEGIRYIQAALAYPHERARREMTLNLSPSSFPSGAHGEQPRPLLIWESGRFAEKYHPHWCVKYERHARDPANVDLAPWVAPHYERRQQLQQQRAQSVEAADRGVRSDGGREGAATTGRQREAASAESVEDQEEERRQRVREEEIEMHKELKKREEQIRRQRDEAAAEKQNST